MNKFHALFALGAQLGLCTGLTGSPRRYGQGHVCRIDREDQSSDGLGTAKVRQASTLNNCRKLCAKWMMCKGYEFNLDQNRCELWTQKIGYTESKEGYVCQPFDAKAAAKRAGKSSSSSSGKEIMTAGGRTKTPRGKHSKSPVKAHASGHSRAAAKPSHGGGHRSSVSSHTLANSKSKTQSQQRTLEVAAPPSAPRLDSGLVSWYGFGPGHVCRLSVDDRTFDAEGTAKVHTGVGLGECKNLCIVNHMCTGIEWMEAQSRCETWTQPIGLAVRQDGQVCLKIMRGVDPAMQEQVVMSLVGTGDEDKANGASWHTYGYGKACRLSTEDPSADGLGTVKVTENVASVSACKDLCEAYDMCNGIEYQVETGRCELWTQPIGYTVNKDAYVCMSLAHNPAAAPVAPWEHAIEHVPSSQKPARILAVSQGESAPAEEEGDGASGDAEDDEEEEEEEEEEEDADDEEEEDGQSEDEEEDDEPEDDGDSGRMSPVKSSTPLVEEGEEDDATDFDEGSQDDGGDEEEGDEADEGDGEDLEEELLTKRRKKRSPRRRPRRAEVGGQAPASRAAVRPEGARAEEAPAEEAPVDRSLALTTPMSQAISARTITETLAWRDWGRNSACRLDGGDASLDGKGTAKQIEHQTLEACKSLCEGYDMCKGVEFNQKTKRCSVWTQPIGHAVASPGSTCMVMSPVAPPVVGAVPRAQLLPQPSQPTLSPMVQPAPQAPQIIYVPVPAPAPMSSSPPSAAALQQPAAQQPGAQFMQQAPPVMATMPSPTSPVQGGDMLRPVESSKAAALAASLETAIEGEETREASWHSFGTGKACRLEEGDTSADAKGTVKRFTDVALSVCKSLCEEYEMCTGVDYHPEQRRCHVWTQPIGHTIDQDGTVCMKLAHEVVPSHRAVLMAYKNMPKLDITGVNETATHRRVSRLYLRH